MTKQRQCWGTNIGVAVALLATGSAAWAQGARTKSPGAPPSRPSSSAPSREKGTSPEKPGEPASPAKDGKSAPGSELPAVAAPPRPLKKVSEQEMTAALRQAQVEILDATQSLLRVQSEVVNRDGGYRQGVPLYLDDARQGVARCLSRLEQITNPEIPARVVELFRAALMQFRECLELKAQAVHEAGSLDGWGPTAADLDDRATAMFKRALKTHTTLIEHLHGSMVLESLRAFLMEPVELCADRPGDGTGFTLGIGVRAASPMVVFRVLPGSVASRLELQVGDRIVAINRKPVGTLLNAKQELKKMAGEYTFITVIRQDREETFARKVQLRAR